MYALVQFSDSSYWICDKKKIKMKNNEFIVRYKGSGYVIKVVMENERKQDLVVLKNELEIQQKISTDPIPISKSLSTKNSEVSKSTGQQDIPKMQENKSLSDLNAESNNSKSEEKSLNLVDDSLNNEVMKKSMNLEVTTNTADISNDLTKNILLKPLITTVRQQDIPKMQENKSLSDLNAESNDSKSEEKLLNLGDNKLDNSIMKKSNDVLNTADIREEGLLNKSNQLNEDEQRLRVTNTQENISSTECNYELSIFNITETKKTPKKIDSIKLYDTSLNNGVSNRDENDNNSLKSCSKPTVMDNKQVHFDVRYDIQQNYVIKVLNLEESALLSETPTSCNLLSDALIIDDDALNTCNEVAQNSGSNLQDLSFRSDKNENFVSNFDQDIISFAMFDDVRDKASIEIPENEHNSSESEYVPSSDLSDESNCSMGKKRIDITEEKCDSSHQTINNSTIILETSSTINVAGHSAPDDEKMFVMTVESGRKKDYCIYCNTEQAKLSRHVTRVHKFEEDVAKFLSFEKESKERKKIMSDIRKKGQFLYNTDSMLNNGERKVVRRPNARFNKNATDFVTCPSCKGDYARTSLRRHARKCIKKNEKRRDIILKSKRLIGRIHRVASNVLRQRVFPTLQEDEVVKAIRYDELIILFGNKLCQKYRDPHFYDMIRQKLRQLGRFLIEIRKHTKDVTDFFSVFFPKNYEATILAVQHLAGFSESEIGFKVPSLATSIGTLIKQIGKLCVSEWIKRQNKQNQMFAEDYLKLLTEDYTTSISRTALETYTQQKRQKKIVLPSKSDIQKLQIFLRNEVHKNYDLLKNNYSNSSWLNLASSVLVSVQLFNRRRPGETERILIKDFENYEKIDCNNVGDVYEKFSIEEKRAAMKYVRFEIRGKLNRTVPILLHRELLVCIELLLQLRKRAGVDKNNPYVFGIPGSLKGDYKYLRACNLMRQYAVQCGASKPETLRGTVLRKHVATMCVNFNLTDNEVSDLANFMGHAEQIHKKHYRQPIIAREILNISKLLETVQGNEDDLSDNESEDEGDKLQNNNESTHNEMIEHDVLENITNTNNSSNQYEKNSVQEEISKKRKRSTSPYGACKRRRWTSEEKKIASTEFLKYIKAKKLPSFKQIQEVLDKYPKVFKRNLASVKTWVSNEIKKQK